MIRAGFCKAPITPPIGVYLAGFSARTGPSEGILDELYARCVAVAMGDEPVAVIASLDLLEVDEGLVKRIRRAVAHRAPVDEQNVVVSATHTHSGPHPGFSPWYVEYLVESVAGCVACAYRRLEDVEKAVFARSLAPELVYNRRDPRRGVIDPEVAVLTLVRRSGSLRVVSFAAHPVVLGPRSALISADYPGALLRSLEEAGHGTPGVFLTGCAGNINPLTPSTRLDDPYDRSGGTPEEVEWYGRALALEVLKAEGVWAAEPSISEPRMLCREVRLRTRAEEWAAFMEEQRDALANAPPHLRWLADQVLRAHERVSQGYVEARVCVLVLGEAGLVFLPSEPFVELQLAIKKQAPLRHLVVAGYTNSYIGYLPTQEELTRGGYEASIPFSVIEPRESERLVDLALELLSEVR